MLQSSIVEQSLCTLMERRQLRRSLVHSACVLSSRRRLPKNQPRVLESAMSLWLALNQSLCRSPRLSFPCVPACVLLHLLCRRCAALEKSFSESVETQPTTTGTTRDMNCFASCCTPHPTSASSSCGRYSVVCGLSGCASCVLCMPISFSSCLTLFDQKFQCCCHRMLSFPRVVGFCVSVVVQTRINHRSRPLRAGRNKT